MTYKWTFSSACNKYGGIARTILKQNIIHFLKWRFALKQFEHQFKLQQSLILTVLQLSISKSINHKRFISFGRFC